MTSHYNDSPQALMTRPHPAPAFKRCCDSCINVPCKVLNRVPCLAQEKQENVCEENGCTDIENCDEICQHSRLFSPLQMQEAKEQAARQAREELSLPRDAVLRFSRIMETKLKEKDGQRDGWEDCDPAWLFGRAEDEMKELKKEITVYMNHSSLSPKWLSIKERVQREAADVANFCMMISDNMESLRGERR